MSIHTRPIPAPKRSGEMISNPIATHQPRAEPQPARQRSDGEPAEEVPQGEPSRAPESRAELGATEATSRRWYRREPWLAVMLAAFVPLVAAAIAPDAARYPLIGLTGLAIVVGVAMLIRQGVFRTHPGSALHRE